MGMLDGVSQCWWLSKACEVNWDAWAAIATAIGTCLALAIATRDGLQRMRDRRAAAKLALISIWPFAHKAAGCTSTIAHELQRLAGVNSGALGTTIQELREVIEKISLASGRLDAAMSLRVTAAVSLGGYLARQSSRLLTRDIDAALTSVTLSEGLIADARTATQLFLDIASSAEAQTTAITGRAPPHAD